MNTQAKTAVVSQPSFDGNAAAERAVALASKAGENVGNELVAIADAKQDMAGGPVRVMVALRQAFPDDIDGFPKPGEEEGNNRDLLTVEDVVNGETKSRKTTFYAVFADSVPAGKAIVDRIAMCERAAKTDTIKTDIPEDILEMGRTGLLSRHLDYLKGRRGTFRASIKKAMELHFQFEAISEVPNIECDPIWENEEGGPVISAQKCIQVWEMNADGKRVKYTADYTVSTFLRLNAAKAIEAGGGFKALEKTLERATKKSGKEGAAPDRRIASLDTMVGVTVELHRYVDELAMDRDTANYDKLVKALKSDKATGEVISSFVELRNYLDDIIKAANLQPRYNKLQQDEKAAA